MAYAAVGTQVLPLEGKGEGEAVGEGGGEDVREGNGGGEVAGYDKGGGDVAGDEDEGDGLGDGSVVLRPLIFFAVSRQLLATNPFAQAGPAMNHPSSPTAGAGPVRSGNTRR